MKRYDLKKDKHWFADYCIESIIIRDNDIFIYISREDVKAVIICNRYIGIEYLGNWEDVIIKYAVIRSNGELVHKSLDTIKEKYNTKYLTNPKYNLDWIKTEWRLLEIVFTDGMKIEIACKEAFCESIEEASN